MTTHTHIVHSYDKDLESLVGSILNMGTLVHDLIHIANIALQEPGSHHRDEAKAIDKEVNKLDVLVERQAIALLALRQPMAIDLRIAISALKIGVIMERMGDLAKNCTKRATRIINPLPSNLTLYATQMTTGISAMLEDALTAFRSNNIELASQVAARDKLVNDVYRQAMEELQQEMIKHPQEIPSLIQAMFIIRNIERMGDYISKVANVVHYIVTGKRVKKSKKAPLIELESDL